MNTAYFLKLLLDVVIPFLITLFLPIILGGIVKFINTKQKLVKIQLTEEQQKVLTQKVIEGIFHAEEQDFKSFKNDNVKQLSGDQKLDIAANYFVNAASASGLKVTFDMEEARQLVEANLPKVRDSLNNVYARLKTSYIRENNLPDQSRKPY